MGLEEHRPQLRIREFPAPTIADSIVAGGRITGAQAPVRTSKPASTMASVTEASTAFSIHTGAADHGTNVLVRMCCRPADIIRLESGRAGP
jgi:hypothetical protein